MADLNVQDLNVAGSVDPAFIAADAAGDRFQPRGTQPVLLHVKNTDAAPHTVTIDDPNSQGPAGAAAFNPDLPVVVPAGGERMVAVSSGRFANAEGWVNLSYDSVTGMTVGIIRVLS